MTFVRTRLRQISALALLAMLGLAFVPTLSQALAAGSAADGGLLNQICSADGLRQPTATAGSAGSEEAPRAGHAWDHCPLCGTSAAASGPTGAGWRIAAATVQRLHAAPTPAPGVPGVAAWPAAMPRAPPGLHA